MVTSKDVAKAANVSVSTVSRVFSNSALVNKETIAKVEAVARQLHYVPNIAARNLKLNKSGIFGVVQSDLNNTFYTYILREMFPEIKQNKYRLFTVYSEESAEIENTSISSLVASNVEVLVFTPVQSRTKYIENMILKNRIASLQLYRRTYDEIDSLTIDDRYGTYLATQALIKNNHRNILLIDYDLEIPTGRLQGYYDAFQEAGIAHSDHPVLLLSVRDDNERIILDALEAYQPSAVIPVSSVFASAAIRAIKTLGKRIKDDISLIIYDDVSYAEFMDITVISHPLHDIATTAANLVFSRIKEYDQPARHEVIKPFLVMRDSIKKI
ncbi:MAG: LacI family DNA-binding transcriptional regulator [Candidatus Izemoplasmatales bacterium]|nr:LacI family DNA-binding transcriptional regulator [Candidatus Izemoplasmatales bacterium]